MEINKKDLTIREQNKIGDLCEENYDILNEYAIRYSNNDIEFDLKWGEKFVEMFPKYMGYESIIYEVMRQYGP